jgi:hypothetical protein|tara:strand:+ start:63 stop:488 length:426 start_codon:yes stop_codon:yes gene_type:complete
LTETDISRIVISIILAFIIAQGAKLIRKYNKTGTWDFSTFLQNGGMPSSHTSSTVALTTSILIETGLSYYFVICALFTTIVMNDSMKVRRETGEEAKILNKLLIKENMFHRRLSEMVGHTPKQVMVGFFLGIACAIITYTF